MSTSDTIVFDQLTSVTTATLTTILLEKGLRTVWIRGACPLAPGQPRVVGRAFTVRFIRGTGQCHSRGKNRRSPSLQ